MSRNASCSSNLKQLALAARMYAADYDGVLPLVSNWTLSTLPYIKYGQVYLCPQGDKKRIGYAMNRTVSGMSLSEFTPTKEAEAAMLFDAKNGRPAFRHNGGCIVAFVDGHVIWLSRDDVERLGISH